jgi:flagellum-specific ATP synthase
LLGRIVDGMGAPIDGKGPILTNVNRETVAKVPDALTRQRIEKPLQTGLRAIDGLLTMGVGQRVGLFSGSGVGKSTLLGEIAKYSSADCNVIALVGERGREVRPFLEDCLGPTGLQRSVIVLATSDQTPLMRVRAVQTAVTIANEFRRNGNNVLFMLDSLTRLAMAQREIGLLMGEPPTARGYTPSVFQLLASTLEQLGNSATGSVTALATVLVDGDDMNDPIADAVRAVVDGHIVLNRRLAERGHFPAIDVSASISRTFMDVTSASHQEAARTVKRAIATYQTNADLIRAGAYQRGAAADIDLAIELMPKIDTFLQQGIEQHSAFEDTIYELMQLAARWNIT